MNNKTLFTTVAAIAVMLGVGLIAGAVSAERFGNLPQGKNMPPRQNQEVVQAIENNDYAAWKKLMESDDKNAEILSKITAGNFADYVSMHTLMREGKVDEAKVIADKLGIPFMDRLGKGPQKPLTDAERSELKTIFENKDYNAWKTFIQNHSNAEAPKIVELITEEKFSKFAEMNILMMDAREKMKEADAIRKELGLPGRGGKGWGRTGHMGKMGRMPFNTSTTQQ